MPSRAERRAPLEWLLRGLLVGALALALVRSLTPVPPSAATARADARTLRAALARATRSPEVTALALDVDSVPSPVERAWLGALRDARVAVSWRGRPAVVAVSAERAREPSGQGYVSVLSDSGAPLSLADSAGAIDSIVTAVRGATVSADALVGEVRAARGRFVARASVPHATRPRAVLFLARAGWEGKFAAAALQEAGWTVRTRQPVAPGVTVSDAALLPLDTARYAAVVALDSSAADLAPVVARFVAQGGGLVLAGAAPSLAAFASLAPAQPSARQPGRLPLDADTVTLASLPVRPLAPVRADAVRLYGTPTLATVAVRRAGLGRVLAVGYDDTWRWRMMGGASGVAAHRAWWSRAVGLVAPESDEPPAGADAAPLAALVAALGPPDTRAEIAAPGRTAGLGWYLLVLIVVVLLAETASRRFRGAS